MLGLIVRAFAGILSKGAVKTTAQTAVGVAATEAVEASVKASGVAATKNVAAGLAVGAMKHPVATTVGVAAVAGTADAVTGGASTEYVVGPGLRVVGQGVGKVTEGAVNVGKELVIGGYDAQEGSVEPSLEKPSNGQGNGTLSNMFNQFSGKMSENGAFAAAPLLGLAAFASGRGNTMQNMMHGAAMAGVVGLLVYALECIGFKLPGFQIPSGNAAAAFNSAASGQSNETEIAPKPQLNETFNASAANTATAPVVQPNPAPVRQYAQPVPVL